MVESLTPQKQRYALETIERNAKLQTQLIEDLLDVSGILQGKVSFNIIPVDLAGAIAAAIDTVRLSAQVKSIEICTQFAPHLGLVLGDAGRLQQVFWNLLSNAVKFTPDTGATSDNSCPDGAGVIFQFERHPGVSGG
ncbi:sensor histidine kinase [Microcoleus sp. PH2017_34_RAT_O_A]|uniref:sensor histidine kinase n=1 Tax=unclassified Microcoleus TaxID=2642155 RepID=UPI00341F4AEE